MVLLLLILIPAVSLPFVSGWTALPQPLHQPKGLHCRSTDGLLLLPTSSARRPCRVPATHLDSTPDENSKDAFRGVPSSPSDQQQPSSQQPRRMDPLFAAMTRTDPTATSTSPKKQVPILGEVTLDRSLFLLVPLVGFAVGGILLSLYILVNSGDVIAESVLAANSGTATAVPTMSTTTSNGIFASSPDINPNACRGLCSSQQQDLEGLRNYMNNFGK